MKRFNGMKRYYSVILFFFFAVSSLYGQVLKDSDTRILFHGLVLDANSLNPLPGSQIMINSSFSSISDDEGKFAFYVRRGDTVIFRMLGYKSTVLNIRDTLTGREFVAGIYMNADTLSIGEVVIIPRYSNLRSEMFSSRPETNFAIENAKYNLEVSSYQGRIGQSRLGDPSINYEILRQQQRNDAYTKGQIPSDRIVGISPLMLIPATYLLMNGLPERPSPLKPQLTEQEVDQIHRKYLESLRKK
ncbi:MAG: hypothetical protein A2V50_06875 [Bacteroidetes bacterium RBG_19FT_COMBO_42_10]|nr:MAG: hypothetical protein A2V50_06875 [Bacteroidetes bacterium RBG_19FT_COMBO_42_10]